MSGMRCKFCNHKKPSEDMYRVNICKTCIHKAKRAAKQRAAQRHHSGSKR